MSLASEIGVDKRHAEPEVRAALVLGRSVVPRTAGQQPRTPVVPASTPEDPFRRRRWPLGIDPARELACVAVTTPFPDVAEHVVQTPGVSAVTANRSCLAQIRPLGCPVVRMGAIE